MCVLLKGPSYGRARRSSTRKCRSRGFSTVAMPTTWISTVECFQLCFGLDTPVMLSIRVCVHVVSATVVGRVGVSPGYTAHQR